ncbi:MAG TPA: nucleoside deaminase [Candidatus Angelobacter sp.]|nr:nucleoside deaminase [Candidatus Angelobacter sp.]
MKEQEQWIDHVIQLAIENVRSGRGGPFASLVVRDGAILAEGTNVVTSTNDPCAHAEIVAIRRACQKLGRFELRGCEIYSSCEPCPMCLGAIYWARLAPLYFAAGKEDAAKAGFDDSFIYQEFSRPLDQRKIPMVRVTNRKALDAFRAWEQQPNKVPY